MREDYPVMASFSTQGLPPDLRDPQYSLCIVAELLADAMPVCEGTAEGLRLLCEAKDAFCSVLEQHPLPVLNDPF